MQGLWSEEDSCISLLSADMDNLSSPSHTLTQVLDKAASCLGAGDDADSEGEDDDDVGTGSESDDDDFDMYYGEEGDEPATSRLSNLLILLVCYNAFSL